MRTPLAIAATLVFASACQTEQEKRDEEIEAAAAEVARAAEAAGTETDKAAAALANLVAAAGNAASRAADQGAETSDKSVQDISAAMQNMAKAIGGGKGVDPVSFRKLKALLPEKAAGLERRKASGEKAGAMGVKLSHANARYGEGDKRLELKITDTGGMQGVMKMAAVAWATTEFERETDHGFERTVTIAGHRAMEKWDDRKQRSEIQLIVKGRFHVEAKGRGLPFEDVKDAVEDLDLDELVELGEATKPAE